LAIPLLLFVQELSNPALQLLHLSLVGDIPFIQPLGHIHRGHTVPVACFQCSLFICEDLRLKGFEVRRVKVNMKVENNQQDFKYKVLS
jgi:hypothetical protein